MSGYIGTQPVPQATQTRDSFTATSGQTSFATSGYTPNFLDVFLNGVKLAAADYTASNGSDVVLATGAATGDILEVVAYTTFDTANVTGAANFTVTGSFTSQGIDDNATSTAMTLDTSGNLHIGTDSAGSYPKTGHSIRGGDSAIFSRTGTTGETMQVRRQNSTGDFVRFYSGASTINGGIKVDGGSMVIGGGDVGIGYYQGANALVPYNFDNNSVRDAEIDLGYPNTFRWKDLYLSGGVFLGGTGSANKLTDYEFGTWTPTSVTSGTISVGSTGAHYTKVGRNVTLHINSAQFSDYTSTSDITIGGVPFAPSGTSAVGTTMMSNRDDTIAIAAYIPSTGAEIRFYRNSETTGYTRMRHNIFNSSGHSFYLSITYQTA